MILESLFADMSKIQQTEVLKNTGINYFREDEALVISWNSRSLTKRKNSSAFLALWSFNNVLMSNRLQAS